MSLLEIIQAQRKTLPIVPQSCAGQTIIVTGANTGLGFEAAKHFVRLNATRVVLAVRSPSKGAAAKADIEAATGRTDVAEVWPLDLASYDSIRTFAARASTELDRIDAVIENAGVGLDTWTEVDGSETTIRVNVLGTMLLAVLLLPTVRESGKRWDIVPRMTIVTSGMHAMAKFVEGKEEDIFAALEVKSQKSMGDRYNVSKLLEVYAVRAMAAQLPVSESGVVINLLNPGLCNTELSRNLGLMRWLSVTLLRFFLARTSEEGSRTLLHAAVSGEESHGKYLSDCEIKEHWVAPFVASEEGKKMQEKVWTQLAARLEKIEPGCVSRALQLNEFVALEHYQQLVSTSFRVYFDYSRESQGIGVVLLEPEPADEHAEHD